MSGRAVEAAGDVQTLLLDKTGTITLGNRMASSSSRWWAHEQELADAPSWPRSPTRPRGPLDRGAGQGAFGIRERDLEADHVLRALHRHDPHVGLDIGTAARSARAPPTR
jgi:potassium-transporting ATPase ATP-binding subunit